MKHTNCIHCGLEKEGWRRRIRANGTDYEERYCVPCTRSSTKRYREASPEMKLWSSCRGRATQLGLDFDLFPEDVVIPEVCPVLGIPLGFSSGRTANTPSVDRFDPTLGYVKGNVVVISWRANRLKSDATPDELRRLHEYTTKEMK